MKLVFSISVLLLLCRSSSAQTFQWAKSVATSNNDAFNSIAIGHDGSVYTTGHFQGTCDFDPGPGINNLVSNGARDIFISKLDSSGNFIWAYSFGGNTNDEGSTINIDSVGNLIISGAFKGVVDFDKSPNIFNLTSNAGFYHFQDLFILKINPDGNFIWAKDISSNGLTNSFSAVIDKYDNIIISGIYTRHSDFDPGPAYVTIGYNSEQRNAFILKLDSNGNFIWVTGLGATDYSIGCSVEIDSLCNIYSVGTFYGTGDFDSGPAIYNMTSGNGQDLYILKLDLNGNFIWAKAIAISEQYAEYQFSIDVDLANLYVTGTFRGTVDFDPGNGIFNLSGSQNSHYQFILKLDNSGNFIWAKKVGDYFAVTHAGNIQADALGNSYTVGYFKKTNDFDPGNNQYYLTSSDPNAYSYFVLKLDSSGNFVWAEPLAFNSNYANYHSFYPELAIQTNGNIFVTGQYWDTCDFDPGIGAHNLIGDGSLDIFIVKLNVCGQNYYNNYVACSSITINGIAYTTDTIFTHINNTIDGCDSNTVVLITIQPNIMVTVSANTLTSNAIGASYQWLRCNPFQEIIGETNQTFNPVTNGEYAVEITENGCIDTSICYTVMGLTTKDLSLNNAIQLFPNPVSKLLQVVSGLKVRKEIYNSMGQLLYTTKIASYQDEIDMSPYSSGIYYIKVGTIAKKFIVE